ncbi:MAG: TonB-dependent receptor [Gammaproteobacteria bacterium]|nr:TonB-dependent receptor [Gammaproteobacteria bacterium]
MSSLTTVDLTVTYRMDNGLRMRVGGRNIFDRAAPANVYGGNLPYDPTRWDARGQELFLDLNWEM